MSDLSLKEEDSRQWNDLFKVLKMKTSNCQCRILCPVKMFFTNYNVTETGSEESGELFFFQHVCTTRNAKRNQSDCEKTTPDGSLCVWEEEHQKV